MLWTIWRSSSDCRGRRSWSAPWGRSTFPFAYAHGPALPRRTHSPFHNARTHLRRCYETAHSPAPPTSAMPGRGRECVKGGASPGRRAFTLDTGRNLPILAVGGAGEATSVCCSVAGLLRLNFAQFLIVRNWRFAPNYVLQQFGGLACSDFALLLKH